MSVRSMIINKQKKGFVLSVMMDRLIRLIWGEKGRFFFELEEILEKQKDNFLFCWLILKHFWAWAIENIIWSFICKPTIILIQF